MIDSEVLICGAGPTGLMAACQLARRGIRFRIIDKGAEFSNLSRALAIQARTLEVFAQMGLADEAIRLGERIRGLILLFGRSQARVEISGVGAAQTPYPFALLLPQDQTERLLNGELERNGGCVEWESELTGIEQDEGSVSCQVRTAGTTKTIRARYLIGADGAHSAVRHALGFNFVGAPYEHRFYLADVAAEWEMPRAFAVVAPGWRSFNGLFPMPGGLRYRALGIVPDSFRDRPVDLEMVQAILKSQMPAPITISNPTWLSEYRLHHRHATTFQKGRSFLCGDAGHIHSPAGGQGMNTGLMDSHNLAWKLALVLRHDRSPRLLKSYEQERLPFARQLVRGTDRLFAMGTSRKVFPSLIRTLVMPWLLPPIVGLRFIRSVLFRRGSQIGIRYPKSALSRTPRSHWSGRRLPHAALSDGRSSLDLIGDESFHLLVLEKTPSPARTVPEHLAALLRVHAVDPNIEPAFARTLSMRRGMLLVRSDQYVAFSSDTFSMEQVEQYFEQIK